MWFEDSSFPALYLKTPGLFSLLWAASKRRLTPVERVTICRRPLLFLLYLPPPQLTHPSTPPPSLAEWQYHLPHSRKRWTVNLRQSAVKNMTHSSTMKTWQTQTQTHTHTHARMHVDTHWVMQQLFSLTKSALRCFWTNAIYSVIKAFTGRDTQSPPVR